MYKNIFVDRRRETIHLWDDINGYEQFPLSEIKYAYRKSISGTYISLYGDKLEKITQFDEEDPTLFESDVSLEMKFLLDRYPGNEEVSKNNNVVVTLENQRGDNLKFYSSPIGGVPLYQPKIIHEKVKSKK